MRIDSLKEFLDIQRRYDDAERLLNDAAKKGLDVSKNREAIQLFK